MFGVAKCQLATLEQTKSKGLPGLRGPSKHLSMQYQGNCEAVGPKNVDSEQQMALSAEPGFR